MRRLAIGYAFNSLGTAMAAVAVAYIAYRETESIVLTALVFSGSTLPFLFLAPLSSRIVTRIDIRYGLVAIDAGKMAVWTVAAVLAGTGEIGYGLVIFVNFASGSLSALSVAAWPAVSGRVAPPGRLPELSALFTAIPAGAAVAGALAGGFIIVLLGEAWVFAFDALTYLPQIGALLLLAPIPALPRRSGGAIRSGFRTVARSGPLREAFVLAAALNLAAFPLLSMLPAMAHDIDARGHVLGILTCAFYVGAALVVLATSRLRRHFAYSRILFIGFFGAGLMLAIHGAVTGWRSPGMDAVTVSLLSLLPLGLAVSLNSSLLQALVLLTCEDDDKAGVLALYGSIASVLMPLGGILLGVVADSLSPWAGAFGAGVVLTLLALALRRRLRIFDTLIAGVEEQQVRQSLGGHWHTHHRYLAGADFAQLTHAHLSRLGRRPAEAPAAPEPTPTTPAVSRGSPS